MPLSRAMTLNDLSLQSETSSLYWLSRSHFGAWGGVALCPFHIRLLFLKQVSTITRLEKLAHGTEGVSHKNMSYRELLGLLGWNNQIPPFVSHLPRVTSLGIGAHWVLILQWRDN